MYVYGTGEITVEVDNKIWRVLTDFSEGFRRFELNKALALPTSYSLQFYMVLSGQESFKGIERTIVVLGALQGVLRNPLLSKGEEVQ